MAQLIVRNFDDTLKMKLQIQAQHKGRSMEEEVRRILSKALTKQNLKTGELIASHFKGLDFELETMDKNSLREVDFRE